MFWWTFLCGILVTLFFGLGWNDWKICIGSSVSGLLLPQFLYLNIFHKVQRRSCNMDSDLIFTFPPLYRYAFSIKASVVIVRVFFPRRYINFMDLSPVLHWHQVFIILIVWFLPYVSATLSSLALPSHYLSHQPHIHTYSGYQYRYYPRLTLLNFCDRTVTGVLIWSSRKP